MPIIPVTATVPAESRQYLYVPIGLFSDQTPVVPADTSFPASMAFTVVTTPATKPVSGDWHSADYVFAEHRWHVRALIGPTTAFPLDAGLWDVWVRAARDPEDLIAEAAGRLRVT